jgi:hypothetical protein
MGIKYYLALAVSVFLFSTSLAGIYLGLDPWLYFTGLVVSLVLGWRLLRGMLSLVWGTVINKALLTMTARKLLRAPLNADWHLGLGVLLMQRIMYDLDRLHLLLSWDDPTKRSAAINRRMAANLERVDVALEALDNALKLDGHGILARKGGSFGGLQVIPQREAIAQLSVARFKALFSQQVEKAAFDEPNIALIDAFARLCASIALNPLSSEALESGSLLMTYLHRHETSRKFHEIAMRIALAHEMARLNSLVRS